jgi:SAM-dependent methyltransferase
MASLRDGVAALLLAAATLVAAASPPLVRFVTYDEAWPVMKTVLAQASTTPPGPSLPPEFSGTDVPKARDAFAAWVKARDADVRARVLQGEEDSLVPLLLFGTSYTSVPRLTRDVFEQAQRAAAADGSGQSGVERAFTRAFEKRTDDLLRAMAAPAGNERAAWARATCERKGHRVDTPVGRAGARRFLVETFARVTRESGELALGAPTSVADAHTPEALARRARAFAQRGLAPDTSWPINFALSQALADLAARGVLSPATPVRRLAIVGPGLDFVDKQEGHDFYPPQTLQPFAMLDALARAGSGPPRPSTWSRIDINPRVTRHIRTLVGRPAAQPYVLHLPRDSRLWTAQAAGYWEAFGNQSGEKGSGGFSVIAKKILPTPVPPPLTRQMSVRPDLLRRVSAVDADIVHQRLEVPVADRFDLVVATNLLLYYGALEQALATANIGALLRPGGLLLTNTRLDDLPGLREVKAGELLTVFSDRPGDGEVVYAYRLGPP